MTYVERLFQLIANLLLFVWTNAVGLYLHSVWNQILRAAFIDTRNCIAARQDIEEENEKLVTLTGKSVHPHKHPHFLQERLLSSALPQHVATAVKCDITHSADQKFRNSYIQQYDNIRCDIKKSLIIDSAHSAVAILV